MKIKLTKHFAGTFTGLTNDGELVGKTMGCVAWEGDVVDVPDAEGARLLAAGAGVQVADPTATSPGCCFNTDNLGPGHAI